MIHVERAEKVLQTIKENKDRFGYAYFISLDGSSWNCTLQEIREHCGTVACVAGWTYLIYGNPENTGSWQIKTQAAEISRNFIPCC